MASAVPNSPLGTQAIHPPEGNGGVTFRTLLLGRREGMTCSMRRHKQAPRGKCFMRAIIALNFTSNGEHPGRRMINSRYEMERGVMRIDEKETI